MQLEQMRTGRPALPMGAPGPAGQPPATDGRTGQYL